MVAWIKQAALSALMLITILSIFMYISANDAPIKNNAMDMDSASFAICDRSPRINCVVDGDTFWYQGRKIRIADINTPEISRPLCEAESLLGKRAKWRLMQLLNDGNFSMASGKRDKDYFGRDLRIIMRHGHSLGDILIDEGLAHAWKGRKESWCAS